MNPGRARNLELGEHTAAAVRAALLWAIEQDGVITPKSEAQVHKALDLLRRAEGDPALIAKMEAMSCTIMQMGHLRREGRVNAYASQLLRLRRAAYAL